MVRYFSLDEANACLPRLQELLTELLATRNALLDASPELVSVLDKAATNGGSQRASEILVDFERIERVIKEIRAIGCTLKDLDSGLVDFLHQRSDGTEIYWCWKLGEPQIAYWHALDTGFSGRQPI